MTTKTIFLLAMLIGSSAWAAPASAQDDAPSPHLNLGEENLAVQGYDLVAYVEENEARKGNPEHAFTYQGVIYYFVSEAHSKTFAEHPDLLSATVRRAVRLRVGDGSGGIRLSAGQIPHRSPHV